MGDLDVSISESAVAVSILRLRPLEADLEAALGEALRLTWPSAPNTIAGDDTHVAWLAPGEWAIFSPADQIAASIEAACQGTLHHLQDASSSYRRWTIAGAGARALIAKGCSLDLHPSVFAPGRCAQTLLAQIPFLILRLPDDPDIRVLADSSLAHYFRSWLADAAT